MLSLLVIFVEMLRCLVNIASLHNLRMMSEIALIGAITTSRLSGETEFSS